MAAIYINSSISCSNSLITFLNDFDGHGTGSVLTLFNEFPRVSEYISSTINFQTDCCGDVGLCLEFYKRRVPNFCTHYFPPRFRKYIAIAGFMYRVDTKKNGHPNALKLMISLLFLLVGLLQC